jgi:acetyl-CoA synthetase
LPHAPDAAFIGVSSEKTVQVVQALADRGAGGAVCFASGFAEVGDEGAERQRMLVEAMGDMAIVGPNCYGLLNYLDGVALWPDEHSGRRLDKGVAIITQSGNIGLNLTMQQRSLDIGYLISVGNQAGVAIHEYIEVLIEDERVTAIGLHFEGLGDIEGFSKAAIKALAKGVPIIALKSGGSEVGRHIAMSHTSSLAGTDDIFDALFDRVGVMRVRTLPQFMEALKFLSVIGPLPGNRIASISCSGGEAALIADLAESFGLSLAPLLDEQRQKLYGVLGDKVVLSNPLDYHTYIWGDEEAQCRCFSAMLLGTQDITLNVLDYPRADRCDDTLWVKTADAFSQALAERGGRGAIVSTLQESLPSQARKKLIAQGIAPMQGMEECLIAIRGAAQIYEKQQRQSEIQPIFYTRPKEGPVVTLDEVDSKEILGHYGIATPKATLCSADEAAQAAQEIGFPVALKIVSPDIVHKTDVGGVRLSLATAAAVQEAASQMQELAEANQSSYFLIEAMAPTPVVEMIMGVTRDPQFGLALVVGAGGVLVELIRDRATLLFPVRRAEIEQALATLRIAPLFEGYRGIPPADRMAVVEAVMGLAEFAQEHAADVVEVDVNPVFVFPEGQGILAVDATIRMTETEA